MRSVKDRWPQQQPEKKSGAQIVPFPIKRQQRRAPRRSGVVPVASAGNLAMELAPQEAPKPIRFPTPSRWYSEKHGSIGFRLFDLVYMYALACQALEPMEALEWGARYWNGMLTEQHGRTVLDVLAPGAGEEPTVPELPEAIRQGFRDAIAQGAGRLLGEREFDPLKMTRERAKELQGLLEALYEREGWLLPTIPYILHRLLRYAGVFDDEY
jgi:hypothetical protein